MALSWVSDGLQAMGSVAMSMVEEIDAAVAESVEEYAEEAAASSDVDEPGHDEPLPLDDEWDGSLEAYRAMLVDLQMEMGKMSRVVTKQLGEKEKEIARLREKCGEEEVPPGADGATADDDDERVEFDADRDEYAVEIERLEVELRRSKEDVIRFKTAIYDMQKEMGSLLSAKEDARLMQETQKGVIQRLTEDSVKFAEEAAQSKADLESMLVKYNESTAAAEDERTALRAEIDKLERELGDIVPKVDALTQMVDDLSKEKERAEQLQSQMGKLTSQLMTKEEECEALRAAASTAAAGPAAAAGSASAKETTPPTPAGPPAGPPADFSAKIRSALAQLADEKAHTKTLTEQLSSLRADNEQLKLALAASADVEDDPEELATLRQQVSSLQQQLAEERAAGAEALAAAAASAEAAAAAAAAGDSSAELAAVRAELQACKAKLEASVSTEEMDSMRASAEAAMREQVDSLRQQLSKENDACLTALQAAADEEAAAVAEAHGAELADAKAAHAAELAAVAEAHAAELAAAAGDSQAALTEQHARAMDALRASHADELASLTRKLEESQAALEKQQAAASEAEAALRASHADELASLTRKLEESQAALEKQQAAASEAEAALRASHADELASLTRKTEEGEAALAEQHARAMDALRASHADELASLTRKLEESQAALEKQQAAAREEEAALRAAAVAAAEQAAATLAAAQAEAAAEAAAASEAAAAQLAQAEAAGVALAEQLTSLQAEMEASVAAAKAAADEAAAVRVAEAEAAASERAAAAIAAAQAAAESAMAAVRAEVDEAMAMYSRERRKRRKIHNKLLEMRGNMRVFCRVRPVLAMEEEGEVDSSIVMRFPAEGELVVSYEDMRKRFEFDEVFGPDSTQEGVFAEVAPFVTSCMDGYNVCIFAYGQTGSGKTFTMQGTADNRGVNWRTLAALFAAAEDAAAGEVDYTFNMSMLEIYNENVFDLLAPPPERRSGGKRAALDVRSGGRVDDLRVRAVSCMEDVLAVMEAGESNRSVGRHNMNEHSSRSHLVVRLLVEGRHRMTEERTIAKLNLIDLAGSERLSKTDAAGARLEEAKNINRSLSALGDVVAALAKKGKGHVPFRNSKLTYLLQDSLSGDSKVLMFVNASPVAYNVGESLCSLNFAARCRSLELGAAKRHSENAEVMKLRRIIDKLRSGGGGSGSGGGSSRHSRK